MAGQLTEETEGHAFGLSRSEIQNIAGLLRPGSSAGFLLVEHVWVRELKRAIRDAGGFPLGEGFLTPEVLGARMGVDTTNGDGFGVGWYDPDGQIPAVFRSIEPAWNDRNHREVASHVHSPLFLAHIRASTGTAVQQTNCHPFSHGAWLWVHNGLVRDFHLVKRDLALTVDKSLYPYMEGSADSEMLFYLALTFGLEDDPPKAVERMVGFVEEVGHRHVTKHPIQMTIGTTDGKSVWAFRYSSERKSRSLFYSTDVRTVRKLYPERQRLQEVSDETRIVVSEPLGDLPGAWNEVPESSYAVVQEGDDELRPFRPAHFRNGG